MNVVRAMRLAFFGVHFVLKVTKELFKSINRVTTCNIGDVDRSLEYCGFVRFVSDLIYALVNQICDFAAHNLRHFASFSPIDICRAFLSMLSIGTHIKIEVLVYKSPKIGSLWC